MKIIRLNAENVKRLRAVEIAPDGAVQIVAGRNAQGKSSVLDSIWYALDWKSASKSVPNPVRDGEDAARVRLDLGDLVVTRKWDGDRTSLLVEAADGRTKQRPQELLDTLLGRMSFDPLAFTRQSPREQVQTLMGLVEMPFDPDQLEAERSSLYEERRLIGRERDRARGAFESLPRPAPDLPASLVSPQSILAEYESARAEAERRSTAEHELQRALDAKTAAGEALRAAQERYEEAVAVLIKARATVDALGEAPDLEPIKVRLHAVEETNQAIREREHYQSARGAYDRLHADYEAKTAEIAALDERKAAGLASVAFAIDGLSFDESGVTYNGVPFCQASSAEQLRVSLALAMATNPTLRVIRITDGSLLDAENMALIEQMAAERDFQVWIERVDESGSAAVVIEDGRVA